MRLTLSTEALNSHGFWVCTSGISLDRFLKNPIMLYNHHRTIEGKVDEMLPIGVWKDLQISDRGELTAEPVFDESEEFALRIKSKVEQGILKACSIGISVVETSTDPGMLLPGQTYPTVTKCELKEVSIVDIPSNPEASVVQLMDTTTHEFKPITTMKAEINVKKVLEALGLGEDATEEDILKCIKKMTDKIGELEKDQAERLYHDAEDAVNLAISEGRISEDSKADTLAMYLENPERMGRFLANLKAPEKQAATSLSAMVKPPKGEDIPDWDLCDKNGTLYGIKQNQPEVYAKMYAKKFGK